MKKLRNYYKSNWRTIEFCPAWNCLKWQKTGDPRYLIKSIDYETLPEIFDIQKKRLIQIGNDLNCQCTQFNIDTNRRNKNIFDLMKKIEVRQAEYNNVKNICKYLKVAGNDPYFEDLLKASGYTINKTEKLTVQLQRVLASNENLKPKINQDKYELEALIKSEGGEIYTSEDVLIALESHNKKDIDLTKISMQKYLTLQKNLNNYIETEKIERAKKQK